MQDVVTKLVPKVDELEQIDELKPWLHRVTYRQFVDNIRKRPAGRETNASALDRQDEQTSFFESMPDPGPEPSARVEQDRNSAILQRLVSELQPDQKALLLMHDSEGWRLEEIADVLDVPLGTVKSRLHRIRALLRTRLEAEMEPFGEQQRGCQ